MTTPTKNAIITIKDLHKQFGSNVVLNGFDLELYDCNDKLGPTFFGALIGWAKPYGGVPPEYPPLPIKYKKVVAAFDIVVLIVLLALVFYPYTSRYIPFLK